MYLDYLDLPNKILGSGAPLGPNTLWDPVPPKAIFGGSGPHRGWDPIAQIFF